MKPSKQIVISASRRTDIPAFYMEWFMEQIHRESFEVVNPYNRKIRRIHAMPDKVHTIVFWSKNFGPFIKGGFGKVLRQMGYHLFFNFTINSASPVLEPGVPPLQERLNQLESLCNCFGARSINWRFDPICFFKTNNEAIQNNLNDFSLIAGKASGCGIKRCIVSFMDHYPKIRRRTATIKDFSFIDPPLETKKDMLLTLKNELTGKKIDLQTCCEKKLLDSLPSGIEITGSSCIPNQLLMELFGGMLSLRKDAGQRIKNGCGCNVSVDVGSYHLHPCYHNCLFCYANPASGLLRAKSDENRATYSG